MELNDLIAAELAGPVDPRVAGMAAAIAARHPGSRSVLFYGSCLRTGAIEGQMLDFYLIVADYRQAYRKSWLAWANRLVPPNVFPFEHDGLAAKYAVLSEADFARLVRPDASTVSVWARFAQPARLVWAADETARAQAIAAVAEASRTLFALTPGDGDALDRWRRGFALTYSAELRAERGDRPGSIVDWDPERYLALSEALASAPAQAGAQLSHQNGPRPSPGHSRVLAKKWRGLRRRGKAMTLVRLAKASLTFAGGIDYLAWKINRHAGTKIEVRPWQRRFPILGALILLPRLLRRGAVR